MKTGDFIGVLAADGANPGPAPTRALLVAIAASVVVAGVLFFLLLGPRADFMFAMRTLRFDFKFVVMLALTAGGAIVALRLLQPRRLSRGELAALFVAPALLLLAVVVETMAMPAATWMPRMMGANRMICMRYIPLLSLAPLAIVLAAMRFGATINPARAGAVAGLIGGGIGAFFYAAHCTDDSPLFVMVWYTLTIGAMAGLGALLGSRFLRW